MSFNLSSSGDQIKAVNKLHYDDNLLVLAFFM